MLPIHQAQRVMVFAPHPDDECLGCGGLVAQLVRRGVPVRVVLVTDGSGAGGLPPGSDLVRQDEFRSSLRQLGVLDHALLGFPDGELEPATALFDAISREVDTYLPNWLVGPSSADAHRDHRCVAQAVQRAAQRCAAVEAVLEYETWGALPASHVLDITEDFAAKMRAVAQHVLALQQMDYAQASEGLCRYRALLLGRKGPDAAAEAYLLAHRDSGFAWPPGVGRPEGWSDRVVD